MIRSTLLPPLTALLSASLGAHAGMPERYIFITSVSGNGNLSTWPEAVPATGLAAGDRICQTRAAAAELPDAASYVAWLSDASSDAYCRVHGLSGKTSELCGQLQLPTGAGPWLRPDGLPALNESTLAFAPIDPVAVAMPRAIELNEFGVRFEIDPQPWTGTTWRGTAEAEHCAGWNTTTPTEYGYTGSAHAVLTAWTGWGSSPCTVTERPLICLHAGVGGSALAPVSHQESRLAFVTSASGTGDLGSWPSAGDATGLAAGDRICRQLASNAGLEMAQYYRAWLSTSTQPASSRFSTDGPWHQPDGLRIADDLADLIDGWLDVPIVRDEYGDNQYFSGVWTGATAQGEMAAAGTCDDWTATTQHSAAHGLQAHVSGAWTERPDEPAACANTARLYCFADRAGFFYSGFEDEPALD